MNQIYTVSQVNGYLKQLLEEDVQLKSIFVRGEISNFVHHMKSGHFYFTLKDGKAAIKCVMFQWNARHLRFLPANGMNIIAFGSVQFYDRDGVCQLYCSDLQPDGVGALYLAFEQLKERLGKEGLFDPAHKRPLPSLPKRIGVVTSPSGAALHDICNILGRRYPIGELVVIPALVQGEGAPESICGGIQKAQSADLDLLIVGRGGGSLEDLWAFNDERVARAIYDSKVPVISAVGHEVDYTIADFAADLRAPTPSAAAELAAPDVSGLKETVKEQRKRIETAVHRQIEDHAAQLDAINIRLRACSPQRSLAAAAEQLTGLRERLTIQGGQLISRPGSELRRLETALEALSPLKVLKRGYAIAFSDNRVVSSVLNVNMGDSVEIRLSDGSVMAQVTQVLPVGKEQS